MNVLAFNIKTIPDVDSGRKLHDLHDLSDKDVANVMLHKRRQEVGDEFLSLHLQKVIAVSVCLRNHDGFSFAVLGDENADEEKKLTTFFELVEKHSPRLVSWNGKGMALPVLHYRTLLYGISAKGYWSSREQEQGSESLFSDANRFQIPHTNLMTTLADFELNAYAPLNEIALMLGLPGYADMSEANVWDNYLAGDNKAICEECDIEVINTYLIYLRFELMRGSLQQKEYKHECMRVRDSLSAENKRHLSRFSECWQ